MIKYNVLILSALILTGMSCAKNKESAPDESAPGIEAVKVTPGTPKEINSAMIGVNGNLTSFDAPFDHPQLTAAFRKLNVSNLRYPAGTLGNYWDWDTGWIVQDVPDKDMIKWVVENNFKKKDQSYTLENFAKGCNELGIEPVFMLNMLSRNLEHTLRGLRKAKTLGLNIKYIEMSNELYFDLPFEKRVYPTPEYYGKVCQQWITAIKKEFPDAQFAIIGNYLTRHDRHTNWTARALENCPDADAVTFHCYNQPGINGALERNNYSAGTEGGEDLSTATRIGPQEGTSAYQQWEHDQLKDSKAFGNMLAAVNHMNDKFQKLGITDDMPVWATEFNIGNTPSVVKGTWAHSMVIASYYQMFLERNVHLTNIHNAIGGAFPMIYTSSNGLDNIEFRNVPTMPYSLSAAGLATTLFNEVMKGKAKATSMKFSKALTIEDDRGASQPVLFGWLFEDVDGLQEGIIINAGFNAIKLSSGKWLANKNATVYHAELGHYVMDTNGMDMTDRVLSGQDTIPAHSITLIK